MELVSLPGGGNRGSYNPDIQNVVLTLADTEIDHTLPDHTKCFIVQNRNNGLIKLSYIDGNSGSIRVTLFPGTFYREADVGEKTLTIHMQSPTAAQTIEVVSWS